MGGLGTLLPATLSPRRYSPVGTRPLRRGTGGRQGKVGWGGGGKGPCVDMVVHAGGFAPPFLLPRPAPPRIGRSERTPTRPSRPASRKRNHTIPADRPTPPPTLPPRQRRSAILGSLDRVGRRTKRGGSVGWRPAHPHPPRLTRPNPCMEVDTSILGWVRRQGWRRSGGAGGAGFARRGGYGEPGGWGSGGFSKPRAKRGIPSERRGSVG